jgi:hypothetical protein
MSAVKPSKYLTPKYSITSSDDISLLLFFSGRQYVVQNNGESRTQRRVSTSGFLGSV